MSFALRIHWQGRELLSRAEAGERLIDALTRAGATVSAPCGGRCFCGKCRVRVQGAAGPIAAAEKRFLRSEELEAGWRLACACVIEGDLSVTLEEAQASVLVDGGEAGERAFDPPVRLLEGAVSAPSLADQRSDVERFRAALSLEQADLPLSLMKELPSVLRETGRVAAAVFEAEGRSRVLDVAAEPRRALAVAVDIGTTTLAAYLVDLESGRQLATAAMLNPQRPYGGDVITRAEYAAQSPDNAASLAALVRGAVADMAEKMLAQANASPDDVRHVVLVGNTMMMHLAAGLETRHIAVLPFVPVYTRMLHLEAKELALPFARAMLTLPPCISGYVGADTVAALLACDMDGRPGLNLMIDIGTNGEIALGGAERLLCCSAAAGPAFEGAHIRCGSGAVAGAIDRVKIAEGEVQYTTIDGAPPASICGSGLVDAVAQMLAAGILDETGRLDEDEIPEVYEERLFESEGGLAFRLAGEVYVCQKDIREVQLAKAAIAAGIQILLDKAGADLDDVQALYLAGGFGNFIDRESACRIGLLPQALFDRIQPIGNGAGAGAKRLTLERGALQRAARIGERAEYIELSASADFQELFADNMLFEDA